MKWEAKLVGKVEVYLDGKKVAEHKNALNYYLPLNLANISIDNPMGTQYPGYPVKNVGLYGTNGSLIKTVNVYNVGTTDETSGGNTYHYAVVSFIDNSTDTYTVQSLMMYSLPYGWQDDPSNYVVVAKTQLSNPVTKQSTQILTIQWKIGIQYIFCIGGGACGTGIEDCLADMVSVSLSSGTGEIQKNDITLYDQNKAKIKTLPIDSKSLNNDTANKQYVVTYIMYDTSTDTYSAYYIQRICFWQVALSSPINKSQDAIQIQVTLTFGYDFIDSTTGIRSTYS
jgi:hypothetical protein